MPCPGSGTGALGSLLDLGLALLLGLAFGAAVALLLRMIWLPSIAGDWHGRGADLLTGGLAAGAALVIMASGLSLNGMQLLLMVALPALGWLAVALASTWLPPTLLLGLAAGAVLAFVDVSPLAVEAADPALGWAWQSAIISVVLGWILAFAARWLPVQDGAQARPGAAWGAAAGAWAVAALLFFTGGRTGFYGDRIFVVMEGQADVAAAAQMPDYDGRRQYVYDTLVARADESQADLRGLLDRFHIRYTPYYLVNAVEVDGGLVTQLLLRGRKDVSRILPARACARCPARWMRGAPRLKCRRAMIGTSSCSAPKRCGRSLRARGGYCRRAVGFGRRRHSSGALGWLPRTARATTTTPGLTRGRTQLSRSIMAATAPTRLGRVLGNTTGVAPDATWIACANLQRNLGNPALYLDCLQFMLAPYPAGRRSLARRRPAALGERAQQLVGLPAGISRAVTRPRCSPPWPPCARPASSSWLRPATMARAAARSTTRSPSTTSAFSVGAVDRGAAWRCLAAAAR